MKNIELLKELIVPVLSECQVTLYDLRWVSGRAHTLQVSLMKPGGNIDLETCVAVSEKLSDLLDKNDVMQEEYTLDVCSAGAEREIRSPDELEDYIGSYVYIKTIEPINKLNEFTGEIKEVKQDEISLAYRDKTRTRTVIIGKNNIKFIRLAVRI